MSRLRTHIAPKSLVSQWFDYRENECILMEQGAFVYTHLCIR